MARRSRKTIDAEIVQSDEEGSSGPTDPEIDVSDVPTTFRSLVANKLVPQEIADKLANDVDATAQEIQLVWDGQPMAVRRAIGFFYPDFLLGMLAEFRPVDVLIRASIPPLDRQQTPVNFSFVIPKSVAETILPKPTGDAAGLMTSSPLDAAALKEAGPLAPILQMMFEQQRQMMGFMRELGTANRDKWTQRADGLQDLAFEHLRGVIRSASQRVNVEPLDPSVELDKAVDRSARIMQTALELPTRFAEIMPKGDGAGFTIGDFKKAITSPEAKAAGRALVRGLGGELPEPPEDRHRELAERGEIEEPGSTPAQFKAPAVKKKA